MTIIVSGELRGFAEADPERAIELEKPVVPVLPADSATSPKVQEMAWIRVSSEEQVGPVADALAARAKDLVYED